MKKTQQASSISVRTTIGDRLLCAINIVLMVSFIVFEIDAKGKYVYLGIISLFFVVFAIHSKFKIRVKLDPFILFTALFVLFCMLSMIWAKDSNLTYRRFTTVFETVLFMWVLYLYHNNRNDIGDILDIICISGYCVGLYAIFKYGLGTIRMIVAAGDRAGNSFTNINTIGMMCAIAIVITISRLVNRTYKIEMVLAIPCALMVIASGSRKAFAVLLIGITLTILFRVIKHSTTPGLTLLRFILIVIVIIVVGKYIFSLPIMKSLVDPMNRFLNYFSGEGSTDESTRRRMSYITLGISQFLKTPIVGIGIGNSPLIIGRDTYLHNNYVELLACGGIIGTVIYYLPYWVSLKNTIRYRSVSDTDNDLCFVLLILVLIMDFGQVSYFSKDTYFYLLLFFCNLNCLRNRYNNLCLK